MRPSHFLEVKVEAKVEVNPESSAIPAVTQPGPLIHAESCIWIR